MDLEHLKRRVGRGETFEYLCFWGPRRAPHRELPEPVVSRGGRFVADAIFDDAQPTNSFTAIVDPLDPTRRRPLGPDLAYEDLLAPAVRAGQIVAARPSLSAIRERARGQLAALDPTVRRFVHPHEYPAGLTPELHQARVALVERAREAHDAAAE